MTGFPATARRVRDESLDSWQRRARLRNCLHHFAPYGFRATWHHLATTHRIARRLEADPSSLVAALDELETARALVLSSAVAFAARRRLQKREGRRVPAELHPWDSWGCHDIAHCPDPRKHPAEPLPVVVGRVLDACAAGADRAGTCPVCGQQDGALRSVCRHCGVASGGRGTLTDAGGIQEIAVSGCRRETCHQPQTSVVWRDSERGAGRMARAVRVGHGCGCRACRG
ncbi:hypothetical protein Ate01nite_36270 [Actinoplanes teichomyceticus]|nr:hypothetical protein Ate01nite_36270 [Actinoplanes teichomyceticus]